MFQSFKVTAQLPFLQGVGGLLALCVCVQVMMISHLQQDDNMHASVASVLH